MFERTFEKLKNALEVRWATGGPLMNASGLVLDDMDKKQSIGLLIEAADLLQEWIKNDPNGASIEEIEILKLVEEDRR